MKISLRVKLSAAFVSVALLLLLAVSIAANLLLERQFRQYVMAQQEQKIADTVSVLKTRYNQWGGKWDATAIEVIGMNALGDGLILRVEDAGGATVWDARVHNGGMCAALLEHMASNMQSVSPRFEGGYTEKSTPLSIGGQTVGTAVVGYYGPYFYSDNDLKFLATLNRLLLWAAGMASVVAAAAGVLMARRIARPIGSVVAATHNIARGNYACRVQEPSGTREIEELTASINSLAESLERQEALRKRLTADVAHELRTPLATLQSHLEALIDGVWKPERDRLESCYEETVRLSRLVGDMEKLSRLEGENLILNKSEIDLAALLRRIGLNFEGEFQGKGVSLSLELSEAKLLADEDKLSQVFINLISNALKYTPAGGAVFVRCVPAGDVVECSVRDTGCGIAEEDLPHIFERFFRADRSRSRATGGAGIGLAIAKSLVDAHHGEITVQSSPGQGSEFTVRLPTHG